VSRTPLRIDEPEGGKAPLSIVLAPGRSGDASAFLEVIARALAANGFRVARFDFPYMRKAGQGGGRGRPDAPAVLENTWLEVIDQLGEPSRLVIGGKSWAGASPAWPPTGRGEGLVCLATRSILPAAHDPACGPSEKLRTPALILQGERDAFGSRRRSPATPCPPPSACVPSRRGPLLQTRKASGRSYEQNLAQAVQEITAFCAKL